MIATSRQVQVVVLSSIVIAIVLHDPLRSLYCDRIDHRALCCVVHLQNKEISCGYSFARQTSQYHQIYRLTYLICFGQVTLQRNYQGLQELWWILVLINIGLVFLLTGQGGTHTNYPESTVAVILNRAARTAQLSGFLLHITTPGEQRESYHQTQTVGEQVVTCSIVPKKGNRSFLGLSDNSSWLLPT